MLRAHLRRGLLAGLAAGLAFGLFVVLVGNPLVGLAEELGHEAEPIDGAEGGADGHAHDSGHEESGGHAKSDHHADPAVSAVVTQLTSVGGGVAWGVLLGIAFGGAFFLLEPALPGGAGSGSYWLAGAGFVTASGAPWLVLPPQPPGVTQTLPTDARLLWYGLLMLAGALACALGFLAASRLDRHGSRPIVVVAGTLVPLALLAIPVALAPDPGAHGDLPAGLAATFRGFVVLGQIGLWAVLASTHAWLLRRDRGPPLARSRSAAATGGATTAD